MWMLRKDDFHTVNCRGTEIMLDASARAASRGFSIARPSPFLFGRSHPTSFVMEQASSRLRKCRRPTHARNCCGTASFGSGGVRIPCGDRQPDNANRSPLWKSYTADPDAFIFLDRHIQIYLDFVVNLVDARDVAAGLVLAMKFGQSGHRYIIGGEAIALSNVLDRLGTIRGRKALPVPFPPSSLKRPHL